MILVVAAIIIREGKVLIDKRKSNHVSIDGLWALPGGQVEDIETPKDALVREIQEVLSCTVVPDILIHSCLNRYLFREDRYLLGECVILFYTCSLAEGEPVVSDDSMYEIKWVAPKEAQLLDSLPGTIEAIGKVIGRGL